MKRVTCLFVLWICTASASIVRCQEDVERPNILWVTSEDNSFHWLGCYGNEQASTPHIDQLAADGIRYRYAYANAPVCAVARCTLITGRYACSMGTQNMRSRYPIPPQFRTYVSYLRDAGYYCVNRSKTDYNFKTDDKAHWDACRSDAHWKNRPSGSPFFAVFNTTISHESSLFANKTRSYRERGLIPPQPRRDPASVELPPYLPDTPEIRQDWVTYMDIVTAMDEQIGAWLQELDDAGLRENTIVIYFSDHGGILPRGKRYIYDTGTHVPLIVRCPQKWSHLVPSGAGSTSDRPVSFVDLAPTVLRLAGLEVPGTMQGHAFLGPNPPDGEPYVFLFGQRFDARMLRCVRAVTDGRYRYIRNFHPHRHRGILDGYPHGQIGWQSFYALQQAGKTSPAQASFWKVPQPVEELYSLDADPWEVNNLANDPNQRTRLKAMRQATLAKMREIRDTGIVPEAMYPQLSDQGTIYEYVHDEAFPYDDVLKIALTATRGQAESLPQLQAALQSHHPVIRYWGALGCTMLGTPARPAIAGLKSLQNDSIPAVRIAAAEALIVLGEDMGLETLTTLLRETNDDMVALEALNVVAARGLTGRVPAEIYLRACKTGSYPGRMATDYPKETASR